MSKIQNQNAVLRLQMVSNLNATLPVQFSYDPNPIDINTGVIYAAVVLLGLYIMIIWEVSFLVLTGALMFTQTKILNNYLAQGN